MVKRSSSLVSLVSLLAACMGCSSSKSSSPPSAPADGIERLPELKPTAPSANGFQVVAPIYRGIAPGSSHEVCTWTDKVLTADIDVKSAEAFQTKTGHHVVVYYTTKLQEPGTTRDCTDDDMTSFRFVLGAGGEGQAAKNVLPGDLAVHIPKGAQIVVNHHYLNAGAATVDAQSAINVDFADASHKMTRSSAVAFLDTSIRLPSGKSSVDVSCTMKDDLKLWYLIPHMHRWGQHIRVVHQPSGDAKPNGLFDVEWDPEFTFHPPEIKHDPTQAYAMKKGDKLTIHCDWANDTGHDLTFGLEMCVVFGQTVDLADIGNISCDKGEWGGF